VTTKSRILVLDDEEAIVDIVSMNRTSEGYGVDVAHDGETAVELFDPSARGMAVLDIMLPGVDG
jgi:DNA-binding response OmpR family regulator